MNALTLTNNSNRTVPQPSASPYPHITESSIAQKNRATQNHPAHAHYPVPYNLYTSSARHYNSALSIWLSVDPMADKYPGLSPYTYCANNPVRLVDPDGREIVIHGNKRAVRDYFKEIRKGARTLGVKVSMNKSGQLLGEYVGTESPSEEASLLLNAINDKRIHVNIWATYNDYSQFGNKKPIPMFGGTFKGNLIIAKQAFCFQQVNPIDLKRMDAFYKKPGQSSLHELTEPYIGGILALAVNFGDIRTGQSNMFYEISHGEAIEQSGPIYRYYFDINGNQCPIEVATAIGFRGESKGRGSMFKQVDIHKKPKNYIPIPLPQNIIH